MKKLIQTRTNYREYDLESIVSIDNRFPAEDILNYLCKGFCLKQKGFIYIVDNWIWFYDYKEIKNIQIGTIEPISNEESTDISYELEED